MTSEAAKVVMRNLFILVFLALPLAVAAGVISNSLWAMGWAAEHRWTSAEIISAASFEYIMSVPDFVLLGLLHQLWLGVRAVRPGAGQRRVVLAASSFACFSPLIMLAAQEDWRDVAVLLVGVTYYALSVRALPQTSTRRSTERHSGGASEP